MTKYRSDYNFGDFLEVAKRVDFRGAEPKTVIKAWGHSPFSFASWEGGFVVSLDNGKFAYIAGECGKDGWGAQTHLPIIDAKILLAQNIQDLTLPIECRLQDHETKLIQTVPIEWDENPELLNKEIREKGLYRKTDYDSNGNLIAIECSGCGQMVDIKNKTIAVCSNCRSTIHIKYIKNT